jgi:hypothetical protein
MAMVTLCHPVDDLELLLISSNLDAADIPYFVVGQNFGSLYPGLQIAAYNERTLLVPDSCLADARKLVEDFRADYTGSADELPTSSKLRMLLEAMFFGWVMPGGKHSDPADDSNEDE